MRLLQEEEKSFAEIMRNSIREGLGGVIGKSGMEAVYINFKLNDCLMNPKATHASLLPAFKDHGSEILEKAVMKELYRKINERYEPDLPFSYEALFHKARKLFVGKQIKDR
ncbi:MAG: hypothetical protein OK457_06540 [Thaumarchaeota archaeon]|nr:hypothetical protein [Nitrososphaerota archaeon]